MADFALELREALQNLSLGGAEHRLSVRVGINSGPVVAGVIGTHRFLYDMWGDTVNTASRMEAHGEPGRVQVTEDIAQRLGSSFQLEPRGSIEVKGKGPMTTYFVTRAASPES